MYYILIGKILKFTQYNIVFKSNLGIHEIEISFHFFKKAKDLLNKKIKIYVQIFLQKLNENLYYHKIFGFSSILEKEIFLLLISISGIGVKKSISILQKNSYKDLIYYVLNKNELQLSKMKGIGKKASQWSLLLEPKVKKLQSIYPNLLSKKYRRSKNYQSFQLENLLIQSLENFGYKNVDIQKVLKKIYASQENLSQENIETLIKKALTFLHNS